MTKKVLVNGRVKKTELCEKLLNDGKVVNVIKFTYEFEYDGMVYQDKAMEMIGIDCKETLIEGSMIQVYFYPETKKWIRIQGKKKYAVIIRLRNIFLTLLVMIPIYHLLKSYYSESVTIEGALVCYTIGVGFLLNEIMFLIDNKLGRYNKVHAIFNGYEMKEDDEGILYHKTYILNDIGEFYSSPNGINIKVKMEKGMQVFLYRYVSSDYIREGVNFVMGISWFLFCGFMGTIVMLLGLLP